MNFSQFLFITFLSIILLINSLGVAGDGRNVDAEIYIPRGTRQSTINAEPPKHSFYKYWAGSLAELTFFNNKIFEGKMSADELLGTFYRSIWNQWMFNLREFVKAKRNKELAKTILAYGNEVTTILEKNGYDKIGQKDAYEIFKKTEEMTQRLDPLPVNEETKTDNCLKRVFEMKGAKTLEKQIQQNLMATTLGNYKDCLEAFWRRLKLAKFDREETKSNINLMYYKGNEREYLFDYFWNPCPSKLYNSVLMNLHGGLNGMPKIVLNFYDNANKLTEEVDAVFLKAREEKEMKLSNANLFKLFHLINNFIWENFAWKMNERQMEICLNALGERRSTTIL